MSRTPYLIAATLASLCLFSARASGQGPSAEPGHVVVVKLVVKTGGSSFGFEPASVNVEHGDTLRFVEDAGVMHNVHFKSHPSGSRLGGAATGPYLTAKGQTYDLVIDARFTDGRYEFVCDPHEMLGMHGVLTVGNEKK
jgi:plastocyanin